MRSLVYQSIFAMYFFSTCLYLFFFFFFFFQAEDGIRDADVTGVQRVLFRSTLWFLLSLVSWNVLLVVFRGSKLLFPASLFLMLFSGSVSIIDNFASLQRTFVFLPFFLLGYFCPKDLVFRVRKRSIALPIVCFLFSGWCFYLTFDQPWFGRDM